ncbi:MULTISPECIES: methyltransferase domain-containing protein [unclassified Halorhodospira]|uniref:methyltransferase domain-containing protein n=1 Tax=unclassified Halorhodospira TaxID=2626748 RepID=UPI001EE86AAB|nr:MULTISPECIES: methyltransferase domain-containing protein [unclassified Halorhodospira]MCG5540370.1 methyltransferase domain-containing protein [Halorhodospira sp. M39old]MCG5545777.1 methyltransferase domain-containing protein [Halorhodospira sp. M38]
MQDSKQEPAIRWYHERAEHVADDYESLSFPDVHNWLIYRLPPGGDSTVLDVGAGSGRDAAWLAERGHEVVAVEPAAALRREAAHRHPHPRIRWLDDQLPGLEDVHRLGLCFDTILLSAVWMHVPEGQRARAFRKLITLLKPGGLLAFTLRLGPEAPERGLRAVSVAELRQLAAEHGAYVEHVGESADALGRPEVHWAEVAIRLPDDGTGALPLLRHIILNDEKSATYKLALLRCTCRAADGMDGLARSPGDDDDGDGRVELPLGLVAMIWVRLFLPLVRQRLPQLPRHDGTPRGLGFAGDGFRKLLDLDVAPEELRIGMRFSDDRARALSMALREAAETIRNMPARYTTFPGGGHVFHVRRARQSRAQDEALIDAPFLWQYGVFRIPSELWRALQRFSVWVEPALITEWKRLMADYADRQGRQLAPAVMEHTLDWREPQRDVRLARERIEALREAGEPIHCVWSGRLLKQSAFEVDHCIPWAAWPCDDLWNLVPATPQVNGNKGAKLPDAATLQDAEDRLKRWWERAWQSAPETTIAERFRREAAATLPGLRDDQSHDLDSVFSALDLRRIRLKQDQQIPEWCYRTYPVPTVSGGGRRLD